LGEKKLLDVDDLRAALRIRVLPLDGEPIPPRWGAIVHSEPKAFFV